MKAKFRCPKCQHKEINQEKRQLFEKNGYRFNGEDQVALGWTTGCCTVQLLFKELRSKDKKRIELKFLVRAYSQYCKECNKVGDIGTYKDEIERISNRFSQYLVKSFFKEYQPPRTNKMQRPSEMARPHLSELCSACKNGCCIYMKKQRTSRPGGYGGPPRSRPSGGHGRDPFAKRRNYDDDDYYIDKPKGGYWSDEDNGRYVPPLAHAKSEKAPGERYSKKPYY